MFRLPVLRAQPANPSVGDRCDDGRWQRLRSEMVPLGWSGDDLTTPGGEHRQPGARIPNRVLLVEDDPAIARMFALGLRHAGYHVSIVGDGPAALEALRAHPIDLVLLDVRMHGMDGVEVLSAIRADPDLEGTRVVMLSNYSEDATVQACRERGALDYVFKWSTTPRELAQTCVRWLLDQPPSAPGTVLGR